MHTPNRNRNELKIWYCHNCNQIHLRARNVILDFTKREFLRLSEAMLGILRNEFTPEDLKVSQNVDTKSDDVLFAETIA